MAEPITNNPLSTDQDKNSPEFGLKVLKKAYDKFIAGYNKESYAQKVKRIERNRLYAMGKQDTSHLRDMVKVEDSIAIINLDYSPLPIANPFLNRTYERYNQRPEKIKISAIDPFSQDKKNKAKENDRFKMQYGNHIQALQENSGMILEDSSENDPKSEAELEIKYGFTYKTVEERIMEMGVNIVFNENNWKEIIKPRILKDVVECGYAVIHTEIDGNGRIKTNFVKPEDFITSYSDFDDYHDWEYQGQRYFMSILEVRMRYPKVPEEKLWELAKKNDTLYSNDMVNYGWDSRFNTALSRPYDRNVVEVVDLYYKALNSLIYEKKTDSFGKEILKKVTEEKVDRVYEKSSNYYVAYKGVWIANSDVLLEWGLAKKMIKPNSNLSEVISPYVIYMPNNNKGINTPMIETMIPSIDMMQLITLQVQRIIAMTAPDGYMIDVSGLSDVAMGEGVGTVSPMQLFDIYLQTGNQYYKRINDDGETPGEPPIRRDAGVYSNKIEQLENQWQREYSKLQQIVGSNNLDAGQITNQAVANSTLNDARQMSENASNYIYGAYLYILKKTARLVKFRLWDKLVFGEGEFTGYAKAIGTDNVDFLKLEATDGFENTSFDEEIDAVIDDSEMNLLDQRITMALQGGLITLADVIMLGLIDNPRYKAMMLVQKAKEKEESDMKKAAVNSQMNQQQAVAGAQAKGSADMELEKEQHKNKMDAMDRQQANLINLEQEKGFTLLKTTLVTQILSKEGATLKDLPPFIFEGLPQLTAMQQAALAEYMQNLQQQNQPPPQEPPAQEQQEGQPQQPVAA